jgi:hypothetical protein
MSGLMSSISLSVYVFTLALTSSSLYGEKTLLELYKTAGFTLKLFTFVHLFRGTLSQKATFTPKNPIVMLYNKEQVEYK